MTFPGVDWFNAFIGHRASVGTLKELNSRSKISYFDYPQGDDVEELPIQSCLFQFNFVILRIKPIIIC